MTALPPALPQALPQPLHPGTHAEARPTSPAITLAASGEQLTYAELDSRSRRLARQLRSQGLVVGDTIAVLMRNRINYLVVCWAAQRAGLYYTPVNWHLAPDEVAYIVDNCGAKALFVSPEELGTAQTLASRLPQVQLRFVDGPAEAGFAALEAAIEAGGPGAVPDEVEGQPMFYSSGTTGRPKGIKRPPSGLPWGTPSNSDQLAHALYQIDTRTVVLSVAPLYHAAPLVWAMTTLRCGGHVVLMGDFDAALSLKLIEQHKVSHVQCVPTMFVRMLNLPEAERLAHDLSSLKVVVHAAAPCPVDTKRRMMDWLGPIIHEYYAGSENNGACVVGPKDWLAHPGTVGKPLYGTLHILDEHHEELPPGQIGAVYFGNTPPFEYHNDPDKTAATRSPQGYSTLGDFGHVDAEGYLYLADRRTDLILSGGVNIYPREVEETLLLHPAVLDVAVVGTPSAEFGEDVLAVVELRGERRPGPALAAELTGFCRDRIAHYKCPRRVEFALLPRTATGKLLRRKVKEQYRQSGTPA